MPTERIIPRFVKRPWGVGRLPEWLLPLPPEDRIGEVWYEKTFANDTPSALLLKYILTGDRLSVQVHPDDEAAQRAGLRHGKSEAWYALAAQPGAKVGLGLKRRLGADEARAAALDGSIVDLLDWRKVESGKLFDVPARTIHAIGAGCVLVEVQQNSDTTYRLFDYGRPRELHLEEGLAVAELGPAPAAPAPRRIDAMREVLLVNPLFAIERWRIPPRTEFVLGEAGELWLVVLEGSLEVQSARFIAGEVALHISDGDVALTGEAAASLLVAYPGAGPAAGLIRDRRTAEHGFWDEKGEPEIDPGAPILPQL
jgi:mannose-6-phosphate isomerase